MFSVDWENLLVTDQAAGGSGRGLLFRVSPSDGMRTIVSNFADANQGPLGGDPSGVSIEASGAVLVADANTVGFPSGAVFRIDPGSGQRTIVSDFTDAAQGPLGDLPIDVQPGSGGELWVVDQGGGGAVGFGRLFRVDASTGARSIVSEFTNPAQGPIGFNQNDVKLGGSGGLLVMDFDSGTGSRGALFEVDPVTGSRRYLSDFGDAAQGPLGVEPSGFALAPVVPPPPPDTNTLTVVTQGAGNGVVLSDRASTAAVTAAGLPTTLVVQLVAVADATSSSPDGGRPDCADGIVQMAIAHECIATFERRGGRIVVAPDLTAGEAYCGGFNVSAGPGGPHPTGATK
jgi:hypothetical protein